MGTEARHTIVGGPKDDPDYSHRAKTATHVCRRRGGDDNGDGNGAADTDADAEADADDGHNTPSVQHKHILFMRGLDLHRA